MKKTVKLVKLVSAFTVYTQAPLIFVCTAGLCIWVAISMKTKFSLPDYTVVIGIVVGVLSGFYGMFKYLLAIMILNDKEGEQDDVK